MSATSEDFNCPRCSMPLGVAASDHPQELQCAGCGQFVLIPQAPGIEPSAPSDPHADDLDGYRIRQVSMLRRSAIRARSYVLIGALLCLFAAAQCFWTALRGYSGLSTLWVMLYLAAGAACLIFSIKLFRRAQRISEQLRVSTLSEPTEPPDFSTLSDGSQHWQNLERVNRMNEGE